MHDIVIDELERHLSGRASWAFYSHLDGCPACRTQVAEMEEVSQLLREFRLEDERAPEPSSFFFYNRVANRIIEHERTQAWGLFSPGIVFFRRVAFVTMLLLAGLGGYLLTSQPLTPDGTAAATIMGQHDPSVSHPNGSDRDHMLVALATYSE